MDCCSVYIMLDHEDIFFLPRKDHWWSKRTRYTTLALPYFQTASHMLIWFGHPTPTLYYLRIIWQWLQLQKQICSLPLLEMGKIWTASDCLSISLQAEIELSTLNLYYAVHPSSLHIFELNDFSFTMIKKPHVPVLSDIQTWVLGSFIVLIMMKLPEARLGAPIYNSQ